MMSWKTLPMAAQKIRKKHNVYHCLLGKPNQTKTQKSTSPLLLHGEHDTQINPFFSSPLSRNPPGEGRHQIILPLRPVEAGKQAGARLCERNGFSVRLA